MAKKATKAGKAAQKREISYEEALDYARGLVQERYGSIAAFTKHADFRGLCGFEAGEAHKIMTYLSRPPEGAEKKVKSAPFLNQLLQGLVGATVESGRKVVHTTHFFCTGDLPPLRAVGKAA